MGFNSGFKGLRREQQNKRSSNCKRFMYENKFFITETRHEKKYKG